jgi:Ca-activated chloride channel family protein
MEGINMLKRKEIRILTGYLALVILLIAMSGCSSNDNKKPVKSTLTILSSSENKTLLPLIQNFTSKQNFDVNLIYKGSVDIMSELTNNEAAYDAVWSANSQWISLGDKAKKVKDMKSIMSSPVILGIKKSLAEQLGFVGKPVTVKQLTDAVSQK